MTTDKGITSTAIEVGGKIITGLTGPFLALVIIVMLFMGLGFFFLEHQQSARNIMIEKLFNACISNSDLLKQLKDTQEHNNKKE